jgi:hypothetical protein
LVLDPFRIGRDFVTDVVPAKLLKSVGSGSSSLAFPEPGAKSVKVTVVVVNAGRDPQQKVG